ncbi:Acetyl-CoA acetyltransferase [Planctomycetes bacterium Poly30]|uniref:Acetyl-CoA acetyltransferase n=1 Tax=Saltatorellus ferox TaxID=2528018 RepID=A0A518EY02_9BACT|nr:Acetyl-CoA acetyltransferase [Planctomycetes bacterium Poly30]
MAPTDTSHLRPRVAVVAAKRTPIGKYLGSFADLTAADLGVIAVEAALQTAGVAPELVGEVYLGNGRQAGGGPNVARQISVRSGIPVETCATTINMACGSGLKSIVLAADAIRRGEIDVAVAGGTESMSGLPFFLPQMRRGYRLGHAPVVDSMYKDGFDCPLANMVMGETAEKLAQEFGITRDMQDAFAIASQRKAGAAIEAGRFADELVAVTVKTRKGDLVVDADEHVRPDATLEQMAKLPAVFGKRYDGHGTVTPGNASGITDGACALVLASEAACEKHGWTPLAWVGEARQAGVDPTVMGLGPVPAAAKLEAVTGRAARDYDLVELNEAFAAQVLACDRDLKLDHERLNVNGGAIALGHPIGATGARIATTMLHELHRRGGQHALATLCISGGMGLAVAFDRTGL